MFAAEITQNLLQKILLKLVNYLVVNVKLCILLLKHHISDDLGALLAVNPESVFGWFLLFLPDE